MPTPPRPGARRVQRLPHPLEGCRPWHPHPQTSQSRVREVAVTGTPTQLGILDPPFSFSERVTGYPKTICRYAFHGTAENLLIHWVTESSALLRCRRIMAVYCKPRSLENGEIPVAVGTTIADRPPHRSVRARLRIRLLGRMSGVEASVGVGVQDAGWRNPPVQDWGEAFPTHLRALTTADQNTLP